MIIKNYHPIIAFAFLIFCAEFIQAQSLPVGSIPIFYNGGFAGESGVPRIASVSFFQSDSKGPGSGGFTNIISYDNFFKKSRLGAGFMAGQSNAVYAFYSTQMFFSKVSISPKFSLKGKYTIAPFVDLALGGTSANLAAGFLVNTINGYAGLTYSSYLNSKNHSRAYPIPLLQAGYTFKRAPESKFSATAQLALGFIESNIHRSYFHKDLNLTFRRGKFIWGANFYSGGILIGFQDSKFKVQFSQSLIRRQYIVDPSYGPTPFKSNYYNCSLAIRYLFKIPKTFQI
jgi:hypothetical protein